MLSIFPTLLSFTRLAPFMIRLALGLVFVFWAYKSYKGTKSSSKSKTIGTVEGIAGILLVIGMWTQLAALYAVIDLLVRLFDRFKNKAFLTDGVNYYLLLLVMALTLLVTGAGFLAFDLPL